MSQYLLLKQGTIHNAVDEEAFVADILIEDGKIKTKGSDVHVIE